MDMSTAASILHSAPQAFVGINRSGAVVQWNKQAEQIFGWTQAEALTKDLAELIIPERYRAGHSRGIQGMSRVKKFPARTATLSSFDGLSASGDWTLFLADMQSGGTSALESWSLEVFAVPVPEPYQYGLVVGAGLMGFVVWRRLARSPG